jgi:uncharacterized membrane protein YjjB (DUF3815 family)
MKNSMRYFIGAILGIFIEYVYKVKESTWAVLILLAILVWVLFDLITDNITTPSDFFKIKRGSRKS